jgi:hypothetical protein
MVLISQEESKTIIRSAGKRNSRNPKFISLSISTDLVRSMAYRLSQEMKDFSTKLSAHVQVTHCHPNLFTAS